MKTIQETENTIDQLYNLTLFYERIRVPYLIKLLDLLSYCGIRLSYQSEIKENQIVALAFFLQSIKGMSKGMTYEDLIKFIKASMHEYPEFKANTHLFELIYNFKCEAKETFKAIYVSNQLLMEEEGEENPSLITLTSKIEELFSTEDTSNGIITLDFLIKELLNVQMELKGFFFFFNKYIQDAKENVGLLTAKLIDNPITQTLSVYKGKAYATYEKMKPMKMLMSYYSHYAEVYQFNERYSNAKKYISNGVAVPIEWTNTFIFQPLDNMKVVVQERVIRLKTDLSSASESSRNKVIELSHQVINAIKTQYGDMAAWISVKGDEINIVVKKKFTSLNQQWVLDYINAIKEINCYEAICKSKKILCSYYMQWLNKAETHEETDKDSVSGKEERKVNCNSIQKPIEFELAYSMVHNNEIDSQ